MRNLVIRVSAGWTKFSELAYASISSSVIIFICLFFFLVNFSEWSISAKIWNGFFWPMIIVIPVFLRFVNGDYSKPIITSLEFLFFFCSLISVSIGGLYIYSIGFAGLYNSRFFFASLATVLFFLLSVAEIFFVTVKDDAIFPEGITRNQAGCMVALIFIFVGGAMLAAYSYFY